LKVKAPDQIQPTNVVFRGELAGNLDIMISGIFTFGVDGIFLQSLPVHGAE
jgi:hypothetical protein